MCELAGGAVLADAHGLEVLAEDGFVVHAHRTLLQHGAHRVLLHDRSLGRNRLLYNILRPRCYAAPGVRARNDTSAPQGTDHLLLLKYTHRKMLAELSFVPVVHCCWQHLYLNNIFIIYTRLFYIFYSLILFLTYYK